MLRHSPAGMAAPIALALALSGAAALAQQAGPRELVAPAQPKVAAPAAAPSVTAGQGGGAGAPAAVLAGGQSVQSANLQFFNLVEHVRGLGWPKLGPEDYATPLYRIAGVLTTADGRSTPFQGLSARVNGDFRTTRLRENVASTLLEPRGEEVRLRMAIILLSGEIVDLPVIDIPVGGGTRTAALPGGGTLTVTFTIAPPTPQPMPR